MKRLFYITLLLTAVLVLPTQASAHSHKKKGLEIIHPWTRATGKSQTTVLVSMTIKNSGAGDRLLGASTPLAAAAEIRAPDKDKPLPSVAIAAGKRIELKRNGPHLELTGFKKHLDAYETFAMTLIFEKAGSVVIEVMVEEAGAQPKPR